MKDRILELLGQGITAAQVATAVGCDDSYISQLMADETFSSKVIELRAENFSKFVELDRKVDSAEAAALERLDRLAAFITSPTQAARVYAVLNQAKRRTADTISSQQAVAQTVTLELPAAARVRFQLTADKQVIEIEGRALTTMPARSLAERLEQRNASRLLDMKIPQVLDISVETIAEKL